MGWLSWASSEATASQNIQLFGAVFMRWRLFPVFVIFVFVAIVLVVVVITKTLLKGTEVTDFGYTSARFF